MQLSKKANVLILSHFYKRAISGGGPPQEIRDFLIPKVKEVFYIEHPFPSANDHRSSLTIYEDGILKTQIFTPQVSGPEFFFYFIDFFITLYFLIKAWKRFDLCIALDNLNTVSILPFRKFGIVKKLVFYTIDYTPSRFKNKILNYLYHFTDKIACYHADKIWVLSERMIAARRKNNVDVKRSAASVVLPMGANLSRIKILPLAKINRRDIVFVGFLMEKQGIQLVLESLPKIISKNTNLRFIIIGQGEYKQKLKALTRKLKITKYVRFKGFIKDHKRVEKILCQSAIGVAPYLPISDNYTFYTDPGKPKLYLGCGLPVIITDIPKIAQIIQSKKAGLIVKYTTESMAKALDKLLTNNKLYNEYRKNAIQLSKRYDTNSLIANALDKTN